MGATVEQEIVSAINLVVDAYKELKKIDPKHELLRFITRITLEKVFFAKNEALAREFDERFPPINPNSGFEHRIYSYMRYERALLEAIKNAKGSKR